MAKLSDKPLNTRATFSPSDKPSPTPSLKSSRRTSRAGPHNFAKPTLPTRGLLAFVRGDNPRLPPAFGGVRKYCLLPARQGFTDSTRVKALCQSILLMLANATDRELARQLQYLQAENRILRWHERTLGVTPAFWVS
jgi:hypothetical protein